jgi:thermitase
LQHSRKARFLSSHKARTNLFVGALAALCCSLGALPSAHAAPATYRVNELLISVSPESDGPAEAQKIAAYGTILRYIPDLHLYHIQLAPTRAAGDPVVNAVPILKSLPEVRSAEPNYIRHIFSTPNDTYYSLQYGPKRVQADLGWGIWKPKQQVIIAIVDTGVDVNHPDLTNKILRDANGVVGYDAINNQRSAALDVYGHGTHVAGIAAAQVNNNTGVAGIAGWNGQTGNSDTHFIKIMPIRVLDTTGSGDDATIAQGITWAVDHGARVINLSLGSTGYTDVLNNACQYAWNHGGIVCAAAGNDGLPDINYPAADPHVLAVAATDMFDQLTDYTNYGSWVNVAAPGGANTDTDQIYSTMPTYNTNIQGFTYNLNYDYLSGSSMSTPFVAGEAALLMSQNPSLTSTQIYNLITTKVDAYSPIFGEHLASGAGRINVYKALLAATPSTGPLTAPLSGIFFQNAQSGQIALWSMTGQIVNNGKVVNLTPQANWNLAAEADMNGDGQIDLIFQNSASGQIAVWYMNGVTVTGSALISASPGTSWQVAGAGDFNGDGQVDLIFQNSQTHQVAVWYLNGTTLMGGGLVNAAPAAGWNIVGVADIIGSGRRDVIFQNTSSGQMAYWTVTGQTVTGSNVFPNIPGANYKVIGITDLNGDNNPDFVFQNSVTGQVAIWYMNGVVFEGGGLTSITPAPGWTAVGPR